MPAIGDYPFVRTQLKDFSGEKQSVAVNVGPITLGTIAGLLTQIGAFNAALQDIVLGVIQQEAFGVVDQVSNAKASDKMAQIETRMLVGYIDGTTGAADSFIIPTANYDMFNYGTGSAGDEVIIDAPGATTETLAFITAVEAMAKYPGTNNAIQVTYMRIVR